MKPNLSNVTLVCADCLNYGEAISSIRKSLYQIDFAKAIFFTDIKAYNPNFPFEIVQIDKISNKAEYSKFIMKELWKHIETEYILIVQHDSWVLCGDSWSDDFFNYDVVAPAWLYTDGRNCGCGGFTLRSRKLQEILGKDDFISVCDVEDDNIGRLYRSYLEKNYDIKFAPDGVCDRFAFELREPICKTFGFHSNFHQPYRETIVVKRTGALGDCVAIEPLLEYYHNKGCKVVIDMPVHLALVYAAHHFPVHHISQIVDKRVPLTIIDLDGSYEKNPKQLHLKSYYDAAGVTDGEIKNPKLHFNINESNRLFKNYFVLHIDSRDQNYRNIYGVNWEEVVAYLNEKGFQVIQVGQTEHEEIKGAIQYTTVTTNMLLYLCAGASGFIGIDSGVAAISVACNVPSAIFFGSVDPKVIHPDLSNIQVIEYEKVCDTPKCWGDVINGTTGKECVVDKDCPPCTQYTTKMAIDALNKIL